MKPTNPTQLLHTRPAMSVFPALLERLQRISNRAKPARDLNFGDTKNKVHDNSSRSHNNKTTTDSKSVSKGLSGFLEQSMIDFYHPEPLSAQQQELILNNFKEQLNRTVPICSEPVTNQAKNQSDDDAVPLKYHFQQTLAGLDVLTSTKQMNNVLNLSNDQISSKLRAYSNEQDIVNLLNILFYNGKFLRKFASIALMNPHVKNPKPILDKFISPGRLINWTSLDKANFNIVLANKYWRLSKDSFLSPEVRAKNSQLATDLILDRFHSYWKPLIFSNSLSYKSLKSLWSAMIIMNGHEMVLTFIEQWRLDCLTFNFKTAKTDQFDQFKLVTKSLISLLDSASSKKSIELADFVSAVLIECNQELELHNPERSTNLLKPAEYLILSTSRIIFSLFDEMPNSTVLKELLSSPPASTSSSRRGYLIPCYNRSVTNDSDFIIQNIFEISSLLFSNNYQSQSVEIIQNLKRYIEQTLAIADQQSTSSLSCKSNSSIKISTVITLQKIYAIEKNLKNSSGDMPQDLFSFA
ncbi:hypothetical protein NADFUDRAFT_64821 [Nadsonia fulvescens var. elongata DSM 6958]|uniref:Uncharacterized protein n=1 Tax=Nadsonia fulvescens var. elongata DSM 6958 TaxID=857566 RepID=A0A1E3PLA9_9ASCO|nr:hypothetical protein NADFUDRAFT_64821 [Nadsonia fulvescens var. elongata DSM 6958]